MNTDFTPSSFNGYLLLVTVILMVVSCTGKTETNNEKPSPEKSDAIIVVADTMNITGKLICAHCYALNDENTGHDHVLPKSGFKKDCASFCSLQGYPIAVLLDEEFAGTEIWVIRTSAQLFADFMTETVRIKGTYASEGVIEPLSIDLRRGSKSDYEWLTIM